MQLRRHPYIDFVLVTALLLDVKLLVQHVGKGRSLESISHFRFCNVLNIWSVQVIPTRVYRLYDILNTWVK